MGQDSPQHDGRGRIQVDRGTLREWIESCHPYTPIDPDDQRYFEFDRSGEGPILRGEDPIRGLFEAITLSERQSCQLFSGFSGTGKSTELRRLKHLLEADGYSVLMVDARDYHDLSHALTVEDLVVILAGSFGEATAELLGQEVLETSYWERLVRFLKSEVDLSDVKLSFGPADLKLGIKEATPAWAELRDALANARVKLRESCHEFIRSCVARIEQHRSRSRGVVFIVDSLERLETSVLQFHEMMESVVRVLSKSPEYLHLPDCHVVYSIPPYIQLIRPQLRGHYSRVTTVLPAIKVLERGVDLVPFQPGIEALSALVGRRIPIDRVFGERRDLLEKSVIYSGGHIRTLLTFIQDLLFNSLNRGFPPAEADVERVVQPFREQARLTIWRGSVGLLDRILRTGAVENITKEEYAFLADYMDSYIVLCYRNGDGWYEVHPLVRDHVQRLARELTDAPNGTAEG